MKPRIRSPGFFLQDAHFTRSLVGPQRQHATSCPPSAQLSPASPVSRQWLRLTLVTITAAGVGGYIKWTQDAKAGSTTLNPVRFTSYELVSREPVSTTGSLFTIKPPKSDGSNLAIYEEAWNTGIWSVMFKQPQLQIGRDYTPLPPTSDTEGDVCLRFFIRKDPFGEVSRYLHSLKIGARIEVRGPRIECEIPLETETVIFVAGGTGIAPALQAGHTLLRRTNQVNKPRIHILWANRQRQDCVGGRNESTDAAAEVRPSWLSRIFGSKPDRSYALTKVGDTVESSLIVREIETLKAQYPEQVTVQYFVDEESSFIGKRSIWDCTKSAESSSSGKGNRNLILVSGPEGFIGYMAGPKIWAQGMELQGPLQGIIKELDLQNWAVWKL
ncbi:cytochrome b5 reductase family protein [Aspergillus mulundensis]|uniref:FAD-binding FR-type domain-containing protein n=1 Tax=Aspergillus mulundensis TaxID=1810919 RepID=A0A3D8SCS6_9EURO|nr:hypothetical protein DSM5745_04287 [Aspergillus mulundensis]RDW83961.1 hypothetical protein DSM5745_04287 [Aspergillus mulundensis]